MGHKRITLFLLLRNICFFVPVLVLFWQSNGLSYTQIMLLQSLFALGVFLLEIPTGYFADIVSRKTSLALGGLFWALATLTYALSSDFWHFLIAEIFAAVSVSLVSGADSSFVYDSLKNKDDFKKVYGHIISTTMVVLAISNILGSFIAKISYRATLYATVPAGILMFIVGLTLKEPKRHKKIITENYFTNLFKVLKKFVSNKRIFWILVYSAIVYGFMQSALWFYQPYFEISGLDVVWYGLLFASFQIVAAISTKFAHKFEKTFKLKNAITALYLLVSASFLLMGHFVFIFSFIFAFLQQFVRGVRTIVISDVLAKSEKDYQATLLSFNSMLSRLVYAILLPILGLSADAVGILSTLIYIGIACFILGTISIIMTRKRLDL